jgi:hypothetical protein
LRARNRRPRHCEVAGLSRARYQTQHRGDVGAVQQDASEGADSHLVPGPRTEASDRTDEAQPVAVMAVEQQLLFRVGGA